MTGLPGAINVESLERLKTRNVAGEGTGEGRLVQVSMEQILAWNPEVIITIDPLFYRSVLDDPVWQPVQAVKDKRVYMAPVLPFGWIDFPPSVNRLIGLKWLGSVLYPELFPEDLHETTRAFFKLFYHLELSDAQLNELLEPVEV